MGLSIRSTAFEPSSLSHVDGYVQPRVLVVEDDHRQRSLLSQLLEDQGYSVEAVGTAARAVGALRSPFDLLITDIDLGARVTGLEVVRLARTVQPNLPILILSARHPEDHGDGDISFLRKPCTSGVILSTVQLLAPLA